jgi:peroxiredoxin
MRKTWLAGAAALLVAMAFAIQTTVAKEEHEHGKQETKLKTGDKAPHFALKDQDGKTVDLNQYKGKIVVLEWFNSECPYVVRHYDAKTMTTLASKYADSDVVWLAINSTSHATAEQDKAWIEKYDIGYLILLDTNGEVGMWYGAKTTPHMYVIDKEGKIAYQGAIDNDRQGKMNAGEREDYVSEALDAVLKGETPAHDSTTPYGCGVKYAH